jgi:TRAP-type C4-dicarboxylate transport system substrate-binding protein
MYRKGNNLMKSKVVKAIAVFVALVMLAAVVGCGSADKAKKNEGASDKKIVIRWSYDFPANGTMSVVPETFKKLVDADESLKGKVEVKLFPASQLYKPAEALDAVMRGDVEIIGLANWYLSA